MAAKTFAEAVDTVANWESADNVTGRLTKEGLADTFGQYVATNAEGRSSVKISTSARM